MATSLLGQFVENETTYYGAEWPRYEDMGIHLLDSQNIDHWIIDGACVQCGENIDYIAADIPNVIVGDVCECCIALFANGECACDYGDDSAECSRGAAGHDSIQSISHDVYDTHFGSTCVACDSQTLAGERYTSVVSFNA